MLCQEGIFIYSFQAISFIGLGILFLDALFSFDHIQYSFLLLIPDDNLAVYLTWDPLYVKIDFILV